MPSVSRANTLLEAAGLQHLADTPIPKFGTVSDYFNNENGPANDYFAGVLDVIENEDPTSAVYRDAISDLQNITQKSVEAYGN